MDIFIEETLNPEEYSSLLLAYIGDAVFDLYFRIKILKLEKTQVRLAHKQVVDIVNARNQSEIIAKITPYLTEKDLEIVKKARNKKIVSHPKNVTMNEYRYATALEALLGYYFIKKDLKNLKRIFKLIDTILEYDR